MRGAQRPGKVKWSRPFLAPLAPLSYSASRKIFVEVADEPASDEASALDDLLDLSDSLPLAVSLMANIASFEGYSTTLARWQTENTALLSEGHDKRSNLEKSIALSLSSPRISSESEHAKDLISLLSLLPDGITPRDIIAAKVPIPNVHQAQSVLLGTSLAYIDVKGQLKALSPVREYIRRAYPPSHCLYKPLRTYFQDLLELWESKCELPSDTLASELVGHFGNIHDLILQGLLTEDQSTWTSIGKCIMTLNVFSAAMTRGHSPLFQRLPGLIEATGDAALRWKYAGIILHSTSYHDFIDDPDVLIEEGIQYFNERTHPVREGNAVYAANWSDPPLIAAHIAVNFYNAVARHYDRARYQNFSKAKEFNKHAFDLAQRIDDIDLQLECLDTECLIALGLQDGISILKAVRKGREITGCISMGSREHEWIMHEAWAYCWMGNLPRALALCVEAEELLISVGMEDSSHYLSVLDLRANVLFDKSEYMEARQLYAQMAKKTSPTCSRFYHAHSLCYIVQLDLLMEGKGADIASNLDAAEAVDKQ